MKKLLLVAILLGLGAGLGLSASTGHTAPARAGQGCDQSVQCTVSVTVTGSGTVTSDPAGIDCPGTCSAPFDFFSNVTLTETPAPGWAFSGWGGDCVNSSTNTTCELLEVTQDENVTATFVQVQGTLTVSKAGSGTGTVTSSPGGITCGATCSASFREGTSVTLTAAPDAGSSFTGWGGACSGTSATCTLTISGDPTVTATFALVQRQLTVTKNGSGQGTVTSSPGGINCGATCSASFPQGTSVTLTAAPAAGSSFAGWGGACSGTGATCTVVMNADVQVTATFTLGQRTLNVSKTGTGQGTVMSDRGGINCGGTCSASFPQGTSVTLVASAAANSSFAGWSGACTGQSVCSVTLDADKTVTATFSLRSTPPPPPPPGPPPPGPPAPPPPPSGTTPQIGDTGKPEPPALIPVTTANPLDTKLVSEVATGVSGNGLVIQGSSRSPAARDAAGISCGFNQYRCYTQLKPALKIILLARPLAGYVFRAWTGACAGQGRQCTIVAQALKTVTAIFAPRVATPSVGFSVRPAGVRVRWQQSVGSGRIVVSGAVGAAASIRVQLRRPGGGSLVGKTLAAKGGQFRSVLQLTKKSLPRGAKVLPGGFVASIAGKSRASTLPFQLRPIVIPAPLEGVVRQAFASALQTGPPTTLLPRKSTQAWAHFRFATQPSTRLPVTVTWYYPTGKKLGTVKKSNRPEITSFLKLGSGLPGGSWVAELRAGQRIVTRLSVRIR